MNDAPASSKTLHANPEHGGVRITVILTIIVGLLAGYFLIRVLLGWFAQDSILLEFATVISCIGAVPIALGISWIVEKYLTRNWSSGLEIELDEDTLRYVASSKGDAEIESKSFDLNKRINLTNWYFGLKGYSRAGRERRVPDKWYCLACQIQQNGERLITFAYLPPNKAQDWVDNQDLAEPFHQISLARLYKESGARRWSGPNRPEVPAEIIAGPDGRYWIAERRRWEEGLELTEEDFTALLMHLEQTAGTDL